MTGLSLWHSGGSAGPRANLLTVSATSAAQMGLSSVGAKILPIVLVLVLASGQVGATLVYPIQDTELRVAYFLGQGDRLKVANFLGDYVRRYPKPPRGPFVYAIELRTPYEEVVRRSSEHTVGYSSQQAREFYSSQPGLVIVPVVISFLLAHGDDNFPPTEASGHALERPGELWREFPVQVSQVRTVQPKKIDPKFLPGRWGSLAGIELLLEFDPSQFTDGPAKVEVTAPDGKVVRAEFDLDKLK